MDVNQTRSWIETYHLKPHPEGGLFSESYAAPDTTPEGRGCAGSIYFMLRGVEISHLHQIDCEEVWYYHAGGGLKITMIDAAGQVTYGLLGPDAAAGQRFMAVVPKGALFASENIDKDSATLVSCMTAPRFDYAFFRLIGREELERLCPERAAELAYLVLE